MTRPLKSTRPSVALLIESSRGYGRGLLEGIAKYMRDRGSWAVSFQERRRGDPPPEWLSGWKGHGIIARVEDQRLAEAIEALQIPTIDLRGLLDIQIPVINTDENAVVALALAHFRERGFQRFAFCGFNGVNYSDQRCRNFIEKLGGSEHPVSVYKPLTSKEIHTEVGGEQHGLAREKDIARWLKTQILPVAVLACNDVCGQQVLNACRFAGLSVPDEIAVLGVDNDELLCELSDPPLSSVRPDTQRIGYKAAELLDEMMRGKKLKAKTFLVLPVDVVTRRSTDVFALEDREIAASLRFIRNHIGAGINVDDVVTAAAMSRSQFERRFKLATQRTPKDEITAVRLQHIKGFLASSDMSLQQIAKLSGFKHHEHLFAFFKKLTGDTPSDYRQKIRLGGDAKV